MSVEKIFTGSFTLPDELLSVSFDNGAVSNLLCKMDHLHSEMSAPRHEVKLQADIGEDLCAATANISSRVSSMER